MLAREAGIDAGDIWGQRLIARVQIDYKNIDINDVLQQIPRDATFGEMRDMLGRAGGEQLVKVLREMHSGKVDF
jgi:hypothetical protein